MKKTLLRYVVDLPRLAPRFPRKSRRSLAAFESPDEDLDGAAMFREVLHVDVTVRLSWQSYIPLATVHIAVLHNASHVYLTQ